MPNDERRPGREVEHRERNDRKSQRTRDPREDRQHAPERQRGFRAEQRTSAPDRAQDQRQRRRGPPSGRHSGGPAARARRRRRRRLAAASRDGSWPTRRSATSRHSGDRDGRPDLQRRRARSRTLDPRTPSRYRARHRSSSRARLVRVAGRRSNCPASEPMARTSVPGLMPRSSAGLPGATARDDDRLPQMLPDVRRTREEVNLRCGIGREGGAGPGRPQVGSNQGDFEEDVEKREDDDGDHAPGGGGQPFEPNASGDRRIGHQDAAILVGCAPGRIVELKAVS